MMRKANLFYHPLIDPYVNRLVCGTEYSILEALAHFKRAVEGQAMDMPAALFTHLVTELTQVGMQMMSSEDSMERVAGVRVLTVLMDIADDTQVKRRLDFLVHTRRLFEQDHSFGGVKEAAAFCDAVASAWAHAAEVGSTPEVQMLKENFKVLVESWLCDHRREIQRYAALSIIAALCQTVPTLFYDGGDQALKESLVAVTDPKAPIRQAAAYCLAALLALVRDREGFEGFYKDLRDQVERGLAKDASTEAAHGSLILLSELISLESGLTILGLQEDSHKDKDLKKSNRPPPTRLGARVLAKRSHRDPTVRLATLALLPRLAWFFPQALGPELFAQAINHLCEVCSAGPQGKGPQAALVSMGQMMAALGGVWCLSQCTSPVHTKGILQFSSSQHSMSFMLRQRSSSEMFSSSGSLKANKHFPSNTTSLHLGPRDQEVAEDLVVGVLQVVSHALQPKLFTEEALYCLGQIIAAFGGSVIWHSVLVKLDDQQLPPKSALTPKSQAKHISWMAQKFSFIHQQAPEAGPRTLPSLRGLMADCFNGGLSATLMNMVKVIGTRLPEMKTAVQERMLVEVTQVLRKYTMEAQAILRNQGGQYGRRASSGLRAVSNSSGGSQSRSGSFGTDWVTGGSSDLKIGERSPWKLHTASGTVNRPGVFTTPPNSSVSPTSEQAQTILALQAVCAFEYYRGPDQEDQNATLLGSLLHIVGDSVVWCLDDPDPAVRQAAVVAACSVLERVFDKNTSTFKLLEHPHFSSINLQELSGSIQEEPGSDSSSVKSPLLHPMPPTKLTFADEDFTLSPRYIDQQIDDDGASTSSTLSVEEKGDDQSFHVSWHIPMDHGYLQREHQQRTEMQSYVAEILDRLLMSGLADDNGVVRSTVLQSLKPEWSPLIVQSNGVGYLLEAANDATFEVREAAVGVIARLSPHNPAIVVPFLRKLLVALVRQLDCTTDRHMRRESIRLLTQLAVHAPGLGPEYTGCTLEGVFNHIEDSSPHVATAVFYAFGELAAVRPDHVMPYFDRLLPEFAKAIQDRSSVDKQTAATRSLGQVVSHTGEVIVPYIKEPGIFWGLLAALRRKDGIAAELKIEAMATIGIIGVPDWRFILEVQRKEAHGIDTPLTASDFVARRRQKHKGLESKVDTFLDNVTHYSGHPFFEFEETFHYKGSESLDAEFLPAIAVDQLVQVLQSPSLSSHHHSAMSIVIEICQMEVVKIAPLIPRVLSVILARVLKKKSEESEFYFESLCRLIRTAKTDIESHLGPLLTLIQKSWKKKLIWALELVWHLHDALPKVCFSLLLGELVPQMLKAIREDIEDSERLKVDTVLNTLSKIGEDLADYLRLVVPALIRVIELESSSTENRQRALSTLMSLTKNSPHFVDFASRIINTILQLISHPVKKNFVPLASPRSRSLSQLSNSSATSTVDSDGYIQSRNVTLELGLQISAMKALCQIVCRMRMAFVPFVGPARMHVQVCKGTPTYTMYIILISKLAANRPLPAEDEVFKEDDIVNQAWNDTAQPNLKDKKNAGLKPNESFSDLFVDRQAVKKALDPSGCRTPQEWQRWVHRLGLELLQQAPSSVLRAAVPLAQVYLPLGEKLLSAAFLSVWNALSVDGLGYEGYRSPGGGRTFMVDYVRAALDTSDLSPFAREVLLELVEFMDLKGRQLPIPYDLLAAQAEKAHSFPKSLRYKEAEYFECPTMECVDQLISLHSTLGSNQAAQGILEIIKENGGASATDIQIKPTWLEKMKEWHGALECYEKEMQEYGDYAVCSVGGPLVLEQVLNSQDVEKQKAVHRCEVGQLRCLVAIGNYRKAYDLACDITFHPGNLVKEVNQDELNMNEVHLLGARAALILDEWDGFETFNNTLEHTPSFRVDEDYQYYNAIAYQHRGKYDEALQLIKSTRKSLTSDVTSMLSDHYRRAYVCMISLLQLTELEEIIDHKKRFWGEAKNEEKRVGHLTFLKKKWDRRMAWVSQDAEVWRRILNTRAILLKPTEDSKPWLRLVSLFRKRGMPLNCATTMELLGANIPKKWSKTLRCCDVSSDPALIMYVCKHLWKSKKKLSLQLGIKLRDDLHKMFTGQITASDIGLAIGPNKLPKLLVKCIVKTSIWRLHVSEYNLTPNGMSDILEHLKQATDIRPKDYKAWHTWAYMNYRMSELWGWEEALTPMGGIKQKDGHGLDTKIQYVTEAVRGFFKSISLGEDQPVATILQDTLSLIGLWFRYGEENKVNEKMEKCLGTISLEIWLRVMPQLIARIHTSNLKIQKLLVHLLTHVGEVHPQALIYPITVAARNVPAETTGDSMHSIHNHNPALKVLSKMKEKDSKLVEESHMVSEEIQKVAIIIHEMWHIAIEQASQFYFADKNREQMLDILEGVNELWDKHCEESKNSTWTASFKHAYGRDIEEARQLIQRYKMYDLEIDILQAWKIYFFMYDRLSKQMQYLNALRLEHISPRLNNAQNLRLAVPGTYRPNQAEIVRIESFNPDITVILSKQRPRKMTMKGSDGKDYTFLLKGREDIRQDERVMQLFGLINALLNHDQACNNIHLLIQQYAVLPLSNNSGVIEWVPLCDTVHGLIKEYRDSRDIKLNSEYRTQQNLAPDYDQLPSLAKLEVFEQVLAQSDGMDFAHMLWLKSQNVENWLSRRTTYTRSLAVMSMTGYILGLGDRHPSNLMIHQSTGQVVHIDFGDCFEVCQERSKFPEIVPFRLTRMMIKAMEVSGVKGTFETSCDMVLKILRDNRDSVMAILEAFIHDPLISWRLIAPAGGFSNSFDNDENYDSDDDFDLYSTSPVERSRRESSIRGMPNTYRILSQTDRRSLLSSVSMFNPSWTVMDVTSSQEHDQLSRKALKVTDRIKKKLTGRDFGEDRCFKVIPQVRELIKAATSSENLCQLYAGWCPYW